MTATIHVCRDCGGRSAVCRAHGADAGAATIEKLAAMLRAHPHADALHVLPQSCLGPCGAGVRVAVTAPGRWSWLFQGLHQDADFEALGAFLSAWLAAPEGVLTKAQRPARLLRRTVGRTPPA